jgi:hypothetical protein
MRNLQVTLLNQVKIPGTLYQLKKFAIISNKSLLLAPIKPAVDMNESATYIYLKHNIDAPKYLKHS